MVLLAAGLTGACATEPQPATTPEPAGLVLPDHAAPAPELAELAFLVGRWACVNPNKTVNDEHWMPARGTSMTALFRQVRRDGKPALHEVTQIAVEPEGVVLRLRHLHAKLEVPERRKEVSLFRLVSAKDGRAEFAGTGAAEEVSSVVYRLDGPDTLVCEVTFAPGSKEKGFTSTYTRLR